MTVSELIALLEQCPPDMRVIFNDDCTTVEVTGLCLDGHLTGDPEGAPACVLLLSGYDTGWPAATVLSNPFTTEEPRHD